jgi:Diaminopimelate decarboxylase
MLDVGGGFPATYVGSYAPPLEDFMTAIEAGVKDLKLRRDCILMCEPGRGLVAHAISIVAQVQLRKGNQLYINDGIYGSFDEMVVAKIRLPSRMVRLDGDSTAPLEPFILNGPTCDSLDVLPGLSISRPISTTATGSRSTAWGPIPMRRPPISTASIRRR